MITVYYECKPVVRSWKASDKHTWPYVWLSVRRLDGQKFDTTGTIKRGMITGPNKDCQVSGPIMISNDKRTLMVGTDKENFTAAMQNGARKSNMFTDNVGLWLLLYPE